jgi:hypothetical protein
MTYGAGFSARSALGRVLALHIPFTSIVSNDFQAMKLFLFGYCLEFY